MPERALFVKQRQDGNRDFPPCWAGIGMGGEARGVGESIWCVLSGNIVFDSVY